MALAALIAAYQEVEEGTGALRATLPLAGRTLVERQAHFAAAAGASPILLLVERLGPDLTEAIDRLRREGLAVVPARGAAEAAAAIEADDRLLFVADGFVGEPSHAEPLLAACAPALLTVPDGASDERYERIDAGSRWAGLALVDGALLKQTAAMLGDWDPQSTLLRRAVQSGARQLPIGAEPAIVARRSADLAELQQRLVESAHAGRPEWVSRYLLAPLERAVTQALMAYPVPPQALGWTAAAFTALSAVAFGFGRLGLGLGLLLLATPVEGVASRLGRLRMQPRLGQGWPDHLLPALAAAALLALGYALAEAGEGWGCIAAGAAAIAFLVALRIERTGRRIRGETWLAERRGMAWLMLPFAVTGLWTVGIVGLALYAAGSFFWTQHRVHALPSPPAD